MKLGLVAVMFIVCGCTEPLAPGGIPSPVNGTDGAAGQAGSTAASGGSGASGTPKPKDDEQDQDRDRRGEPSDSDAGQAVVDDDDDDDDDDDSDKQEPSISNPAPDAGQVGPVDAATPVSTPTALDPVEGLVGTWSGEVEDLFGRITPTCLRISQVGMTAVAGEAIYRGTVNCRIELTYLESEGVVHSFNEQQIEGSGCPRGELKLSLNADDTLDYTWYVNDGDIPESKATLDRVDACPWQPNF
jgi:hypothetical protein